MSLNATDSLKTLPRTLSGLADAWRRPIRLRVRLAGVTVSLMLGCMLVWSLAFSYVGWLEAQARRADRLAADRVLEATRWRAWVNITNDAAMSSIMNTNQISQGVLDQRVQSGLSGVAASSKAVARDAVSAVERQSIQAVQSQGEELDRLIKATRQTRAEGELAKAVLMVARDLQPKAAAYLKSIDAHIARVEQGAADEAAAYEARRRTGFAVAVGSALLMVALGVLVALRFSSSIAQQIAACLNIARNIATGDLSQAVHSERSDELGDLVRALETMRGTLSQNLATVRQAVGGLATTSSHIARGSTDLSKRTDLSMTSLQTMAASMLSMSRTVDRTATAAQSADQMAAQATLAAERGGKVVNEVVSTMEEIAASSRRIADIVGVIDGIAFQTNILALNAAVEAARAGDQGRGFAAVASEVRSLAQRSADAAKEIRKLIGTSTERVESGSILVQAAGTAMSEIVDYVKRVSRVIRDTVVSADQQRSEIGEINGAVDRLDVMTKQNATLVEESAAAGHSLEVQASKLSKVVSAFQLESP